MRILIPYQALLTVTSITNTPATYGSIVATQELRCAMDADPVNRTTWQSGNYDQPIIFRYSGMTLPFTITSGTGVGQGISSVFIDIQRTVGTAVSGNYNQFEYWGSADGASYSTLEIGKLGDGSDQGAAIRISSLPTDKSSNPRNVRTILTYDSGLYTSDWHKIQLYNATATGGNYYLYEIMHGILFYVPGYQRAYQQRELVNAGSVVSKSDYGNMTAFGEQSRPVRYAKTYTIAALTVDYKNLLVNIVKYCRGSFPVLIVEEDSNVETWYKAILRSIEWREPYSDEYTVDIECEEV